ncbi:MAG: plasmid pRiA4b ORF-3 family protein [Propionibacteriaceae bacterium]|nr:plasmid pRiA4b ORF-3 family protein [Propionibacteriaceae bacterium]
MTKSEVVRIEVRLIGVEDPAVFRVLDVLSDLDLGKLHCVLQLALGWTNSHLHGFSLVDPFCMEPGGDERRWVDIPGYTKYNLDVEETDQDENETSLGTMLRSGPLYYQYDFGDDWIHKIELSSQEPELLPQGEWAQIVSGSGRCPLEDVGGLSGWAEFKEAQTGSDYEHRRHLLAWVAHTPTSIDPSRLHEFDLDLANRQLSMLALPVLDTYDKSTLISRVLANPRPLTQAAILGTGCLVDNPDEVDVLDQQAFLRPFRWFVERTINGLALTKAGWLPPTIVQAAVADLGERWGVIGKANREIEVWQVAGLRAEVTRLGLIQKRNGKLHATKAACRVVDNDEALWDLIAQRMATRWVSEGHRVATGFFMLALTSERPMTIDALSAFCLLGLLINRFDRADGSQLSKQDAWSQVSEQWHCFRYLGLIDGAWGRPDAEYSFAPALRAFASAVLLSGTSR